MGVDGGQVLLVLEVVHVVIVPLDPATGGLEVDSSVGVHGGLQELAGPEVPEQHQSNSSS